MRLWLLGATAARHKGLVLPLMALHVTYVNFTEFADVTEIADVTERKDMADTVSRSWFAVFPYPEKHGYSGSPEEIVEQLKKEWI